MHSLLTKPREVLEQLAWASGKGQTWCLTVYVPTLQSKPKSWEFFLRACVLDQEDSCWHIQAWYSPGPSSSERSVHRLLSLCVSLLIRKLPLELKYVSQWISWAPCRGVIHLCVLQDNPTPRWHMEMPTALQIKESSVFQETGWLLEGRQWARLTQAWSLASAVLRGNSWLLPACPFSSRPFLCFSVSGPGLSVNPPRNVI